MDDLKFLPFYERLSIQLPGYIFSKVVISVLLGLAFLAAHYTSIEDNIFEDWSWFLGVLISTAMACLYFATHTLHTLLSAMDIHLRPNGNQVPMRALNRLLSDRNFVLSGLFFGLLNCVFGYCFGLPSSSGRAVATILSGYFLVGFIGGMGVLGIYGVFVAINSFAQKAKHYFDFTSPDGCGGTLFIGEALVVFSSVTLIVGVMISIYIFKTNWTGSNTWSVILLKYFWIVFPYAMSLFVLIAPAVALHSELRMYKTGQEALLKRRLAEIGRSLEKRQSRASSRKDLRDDYEFRQNARRDLSKMRTWPFSIGASSRYLIVLVGNIVASLNTVFGWIAKSLRLGSL